MTRSIPRLWPRPATTKPPELSSDPISARMASWLLLALFAATALIVGPLTMWLHTSDQLRAERAAFGGISHALADQRNGYAVVYEGTWGQDEEQEFEVWVRRPEGWELVDGSDPRRAAADNNLNSTGRN